MTKLMVPPRPEGAETPDEKKDLEKDPKVFTVVNPSPAVIPIQIPPPEKPKRAKAKVCGFLTRCLLLVSLLFLFALALVILFGGVDGFKTLIGQNQVHHVIIVDQPQQQFSANTNLNAQDQQKPQADEQKTEPEEVQVNFTMKLDLVDASTEQAPLIPSVTNLNMMDTVLNVMNAVKKEIEGNNKVINHDINTSEQAGAPIESEMHVLMSNNPDGPAMIIISSDDGDSTEEQTTENSEPERIEGGNVMELNNSNLNDMQMRREQALRMWRLRRIQQVLYEQQMMREMVSRAIMQRMQAAQEEAQQQRQSEMMEQQQRAAQWQHMQMMRGQHEQMMRQQQWQQQQQQQQQQQERPYWQQPRPQPEYWPRPENVLYRPHWAPQEEHQQQWARYWVMQREAQMASQRAAQQQQWQQWRWQQEQQARAQAMVAAQQQAQEARMIQAQHIQQQMKMQQIHQAQIQAQQQAFQQQQQQLQQQQAQAQQPQAPQPAQSQEPQPTPQQPHSVLLYRPIHWQHVQPQTEQPPQQPPQEEQKDVPVEVTNENGVPVPVRPHDASAQMIVDNMQAQQPQPENPVLPSIADRIYQRYQQIAQNYQSGAGYRPIYSAIPVETPEEAAASDATPEPYDHDSIYKEMLRKSLELQQQKDREVPEVTEAPPAERTTQAEIEDTTEPVVIEDTFPRFEEADKVHESSESVESVDTEEKPEEKEIEGSGEAMDPLAEFFKYFETEAVKLSHQAKTDVANENAPARVIDDSTLEKTTSVTEMPTPTPLVLNAEVDEAEPHIVNMHKQAAQAA